MKKSILGQYFKTIETMAKQKLFRRQHFELQGQFIPLCFQVDSLLFEA